eukprot:6297900-Alexandrium_andersonii.AAC.1
MSQAHTQKCHRGGRRAAPRWDRRRSRGSAGAEVADEARQLSRSREAHLLRVLEREALCSTNRRGAALLSSPGGPDTTL